MTKLLIFSNAILQQTSHRFSYVSFKFQYLEQRTNDIPDSLILETVSWMTWNRFTYRRISNSKCSLFDNIPLVISLCLLFVFQWSRRGSWAGGLEETAVRVIHCHGWHRDDLRAHCHGAGQLCLQRQEGEEIYRINRRTWGNLCLQLEAGRNLCDLKFKEISSFNGKKVKVSMKKIKTYSPQVGRWWWNLFSEPRTL